MTNYIDLPSVNVKQIRKKFYIPESIKHPAKTHIPTIIWILERFVKDGDVVLDPMAGIFTTGVEGMRLFPNCVFIGVELEDRFVKMARANIRKVENIAKDDKLKKIGKAICIRGDARELEKVLQEKVDKIITSPPFGRAQSGGGIAKKGYTKGERTDLVGKRSYMPENTGNDPNNIDKLRYGSIEKLIPNSSHADFENAKSKTYLGEMLKVYRQCYRVLRPDGLMILVTKDFIRNKKRVHLTEDTIKLCELAGFKHIATYHRKIEHPSFWRILYKKRYPDAEQIEEEDITVFKKGFEQ